MHHAQENTACGSTALRTRSSRDRAGVDVACTTDLLWFYFGYGTLHHENGWSYERSEKWLTAQATHELLKPS